MKVVSINFIILIFIMTLLFPSCAKMGKADMKSVSPSMYSESEDSANLGGSQSDERSNISTEDIMQAERKIKKSGRIDFTVKNLENTENEVKKVVNDLGGYVSKSNYYTNGLSIEVKIPQKEFENFLTEANKFGKITGKNIQADDVTMQYYDLEGRIKNKRTLQERLRSYLDKANNIEEAIKVEYELNRVTADLESMEGQFKNLSHLISFGTLNLEFRVPYTTEVSRAWPSLKKGLGNVGFFIINFLYYGLLFILYFIIIGVPVILVAGLIYMVSFGRIGLIKKLFRFLNGK